MPIGDRREELQRGYQPLSTIYGPISEDRQNTYRRDYEQRKGQAIVQGAQQGIAPSDLGGYGWDRANNRPMSEYHYGQPKPTPSPAIEAPRGQDPQGYGFSNNYHPSPQAQLLGQVLQALQDPRNQWMGMGMAGTLGRAGKFFGKAAPEMGGFRATPSTPMRDHLVDVRDLNKDVARWSDPNPMIRQQAQDRYLGYSTYNQNLMDKTWAGREALKQELNNPPVN